MEIFTLITGATGGLGKEFCHALARRGDNLFLTGRSEQRLAALKQELSGLYPSIKILYYPCMLDDQSSRVALFEELDRQGVRFGKFIGVAGVDTQLAFCKYTQEMILFQLRVNFEANVSLSRYVLNKRADNLSILIVSSMSGTCPMPYFAIYSASKCAVTNFFSALRSEVKGQGVTVTVLAPGGIPTRADIVEDIKKQGFKGKLSAKPACFVVGRALKGMDRNKRLVVPGLFNKITYFFTRILPVSIQTAFVAKNWGNKEKDAFFSQKQSNKE